jgi:tight adherence protein B
MNVQREVGGNLAEILTKLGYVIRERFRLRGQVRAASAHGRLTAGVLTVMPVVTALGLMVLWPGYLAFMANDKHGRFIILGAIILQTTGYLVMKRIVNIKV